MAEDNAGALAGQTLGGYEIASLLGVGGMAEVYRARDPALARDVAVKVLPPALAHDPGYVERFRDEGRRVAALDHPNVVPVYQFGEERDLLFLVMPLLRESLRDRMQRAGVFAPAAAAGIVTEIAQALDAAHALGLVHRDVKPENVLLDAEGKALLTDFGIARPEAGLRAAGAARTLASTGLPVGTPEYMAPEQLKATAVDHRVDVYGLGAVLYELVTGEVPYAGATPYEVAAKVLTETFIRPSARAPSLWPELDTVIETALEKDPTRRFPDVRSFVAALHHAVLLHDPAARGLALPQGWAETMPSVETAHSFPATGDASPLIPVFASPVGIAERWRDHFREPAGGDRKALLVVAALCVLLIGICGGSGLAILGQYSGSSSPGDVLSSFISGNATDTSGDATPGSTASGGNGSVNSGAATTGVNTPPSGGAPAPTLGPGTPTATVGPGTPTPTPSIAPSATPGTTPSASPTPQPTATSAPPPSPLVVSPSLIMLNKAARSCSGQQTITNHNGIAVTWGWSSASPSMQGLSYTINGSTGGSGMPQGITSSGATDTVSFTFSCTGGQYNTVTMQDDLGNSYTFSVQQ